QVPAPRSPCWSQDREAPHPPFGHLLPAFAGRRMRRWCASCIAGMTPSLVSTCDKARAGWPCDEKMEKLRDAYAHASDPAKRKAIAEEVQKYNLEIVTHVWLGEWFGVSAVRKNITVLNPLPPMTVFWGVTKK